MRPPTKRWRLLSKRHDKKVPTSANPRAGMAAALEQFVDASMTVDADTLAERCTVI